MIPEMPPTQGIIAVFPFLVKGSLPVAVMRDMRARGYDVTIAHYLAVAGGYTMDPLEDFASENRLVDLGAHLDESGTDALEALVTDRRIGLVLQIGAPWAYPQLARLKERLPRLRMMDMLYNNGPHFHSFALHGGSYDAVLVESAEMVRLLEGGRHGSRVIKVESGVDLERFMPAGRAAHAPEADLVLGFIGRMSYEKNPLGFVALAERLYSALPWLRFVMFGHGGLSEDVRAAVAASSAASAIRFEGFADHPADALAKMDVLMVPSLLDGRPAAVMEANACGVPVIGVPVGGIPELIEEGRNGHIVSLNDVGRIAVLLECWRADPQRFAALRASAREVAEARFDWRRMMDAYEAAFRHTLSQTARPVAFRA